jgi:hypothetical protein
MNEKEILEKYGNVPLKFSSYYKFSFSFTGEAEDGTKIKMSVGGHPDDIYREEVSCEEVRFLIDGEYNYASGWINNVMVWDINPLTF